MRPTASSSRKLSEAAPPAAAAPPTTTTAAATSVPHSVRKERVLSQSSSSGTVVRRTRVSTNAGKNPFAEAQAGKKDVGGVEPAKGDGSNNNINTSSSNGSSNSSSKGHGKGEEKGTEEQQPREQEKEHATAATEATTTSEQPQGKELGQSDKPLNDGKQPAAAEQGDVATVADTTSESAVNTDKHDLAAPTSASPPVESSTTASAPVGAAVNENHIAEGQQDNDAPAVAEVGKTA